MNLCFSFRNGKVLLPTSLGMESMASAKARVREGVIQTDTDDLTEIELRRVKIISLCGRLKKCRPR